MQINTFLFTDIEGSTRLWEQYPDAMSLALKNHNTLLTEAIEAHGGKIFKSVGDGVYAVFESALNAVQAAAEAQRKLQRGQGTDRLDTPSIKLRVRIGVHTGPAEERDNDYFGQTLNRVARLTEAANGEQILISSTTQQQVGNNLPVGLELRDLNDHRLRDINDPEHIYQVIVADLPPNLTPIRTLTSRPTNLPAQLTSFVGREKDVTEICRRLRSPLVRLLTLRGPGGIGKTRLSIAVGTILHDEFSDGVFFINLALLAQADTLLETVAQVLNVEESGEDDLLEDVKRFLQDRHLLLIFDNFEHVLDAAPLVNDLLASALGLKVITTSRELLMIYGEHSYQVAPLILPQSNFSGNVETLLQYDVINLFVQRVQIVQPDFQVNDQNSEHIIEICRCLEGLPLAIELAAMRAHDLTLEAIVEQLSSRLETLSQGPRDLPSRQRTMRGAVAWSYNLLTEDEQEAFDLLGVFVGPFSLDAAQLVDGDALQRLMEKSLLQYNGDPQQPMFWMLETLREFAQEQLLAKNQMDEANQQHATYYEQFLEDAETKLTGADQAEWFRRVESEQYNIQAAIGWLLERSKPEQAGRITGIMWRSWSAQSRLSTGRRWLEQVLDHKESLSPNILAKVAQGAGRIALHQLRYADAISNFEVSLKMYKQIEDIEGQANLYRSLGEAELQNHNELAAEKYFNEGLARFTELGDHAGLARSLDYLGRIAIRAGNLSGAESLLQQSLDLARQYGSTESKALVLNSLAEVLRAQEKYDEAEIYYQESLALYRELDFDIGVAVLLHNLGLVAQYMGKHKQALNSFQEALQLLQTIEEKQIIAECFAGVASVFLSLEKVTQSVLLLSAAKKLLDSLGSRLESADQIGYDRTMEITRSKLEENDWLSSWIEGETMSVNQIITDVVLK